MTRRTLTTIVLAFSLILTTAAAAWSFTFPHQVFQLPNNTFKTMEPPPPPPPPFGVGSVATYSGHVDSVTVSSQDGQASPKAPKCWAHFVTDDQKTFKVFADVLYGVSQSDPELISMRFFKGAVCGFLQAAATQGWPLNVLVTVTQMANNTDPSEVVIQRIGTGPDAQPVLSTNLNFVSCPNTFCPQTGSVTSLIVDVRRQDLLCQAVLNVVPTGSGLSLPQKAWINIAFTPGKFMIDSQGRILPDTLDFSFIQTSICAGLLDAMESGDSVTVAGNAAVGGSTITVLSLERKGPGSQ